MATVAVLNYVVITRHRQKTIDPIMAHGKDGSVVGILEKAEVGAKQPAGITPGHLHPALQLVDAQWNGQG